jgi:hypothetical protein
LISERTAPESHLEVCPPERLSPNSPTPFLNSYHVSGRPQPNLPDQIKSQHLRCCDRPHTSTNYTSSAKWRRIDPIHARLHNCTSDFMLS